MQRSCQGRQGHYVSQSDQVRKKIWSVLPVFRSSVFRSFLRLDVFQGLISRLPVQLSAEIASKPGILVSLTDQQVLCLDNGHTETIPHSFSSFLLQITFVSMHVEILELTSSDKILELVNTRPQVNRCGHSIIYFFVLRSFCLRLCLSCRGVRWTSSSGCLPSSSPSGRTP